MALVISVLLNVIVIYSSIIKVERLNASWYNFTLNYANSIHFANTASIDNTAGISSQYEDLKYIQQQLSDLQLLPKGGAIVGDSTIMQSETLLKYQFAILEEMKQELKQSNKISKSTNYKYMKAEQSWDEVFKSFRGQLKTINPFARSFNTKKWQQIYTTAFSAKDSIQLTPLSQ